MQKEAALGSWHDLGFSQSRRRPVLRATTFGKLTFVGIGKMRGWLKYITRIRRTAGFKPLITLHETGNVAGFNPVLVMDVWEHAFLLDYKPAERPKYIEAFFSNIDWRRLDQRLKSQTSRSTAGD